jgi:hypothetical protein
VFFEIENEPMDYKNNQFPAPRYILIIVLWTLLSVAFLVAGAEMITEVKIFGFMYILIGIGTFGMVAFVGYSIFERNLM